MSATLQIFQGENVLDGAQMPLAISQGLFCRRCLPPEIADAENKGDHHQQSEKPEQSHHDLIGNDGIERTGAGIGAEEAVATLGQQGEDGDEEDAGQGYRQGCKAAVPEQARHEFRRGELLVGFQPKFGHRPGEIKIELVGRDILAGIIAITAVMTEVGEIFQFAVGKGPAQLHGRKNCAKAFTIPARVADRHDPPGFLQRFR